MALISYTYGMGVHYSTSTKCWAPMAQEYIVLYIYMLKPEHYVQFRGEGYNDMSEYIKVEMRLSLCVDQILTQVLGV